jgi:hypothetical protein
MKAIDLLRWISYEGITGEYYNVLNIDEDFDFESFFGYKFETKEYGNYFCYYTDMIDSMGIMFPTDNACHKLSGPIFPTFSIETDSVDKWNEKVFIHFYKIED